METTIPAAHGADPHFKLNDDLKLREQLGNIGLAERFIDALIRRYFPDRAPAAIRILDVGTGQGHAVRALRGLGYDAYGLEPGGRYDDAPEDMRPYVFPVYAHEVPAKLPHVEKFDFVFSSGVVEHVGTSDGNSSLVPNFRDFRLHFISSQLYLLRDGGILMVCGPNRLFPFDFQHGDHYYGPLRFFDRFPVARHMTLPWHPKNHLVSYNDLKRLALQCGRELTFIYPDQTDYSSMTKLRNHPRAGRLFRRYMRGVSTLPPGIRQLFEPHTVFMCRLERGVRGTDRSAA